MRSLRPYLVAFHSGLRRGLASPAELAVRLIFYAIVLAVFAAIWQAAMQARGGSVGGYDLQAIFWYIAGAEAAVVATKPRTIEEIGAEIASGDVVTALLRPVSFAGFRIAVELGEALVRLAGCAIVALPVGTLLQGPPPVGAGLALYVPAAVVAVACNVAAQHAFAASTFWLEDAAAGWFVYQKLIFLLGGMLLPFELLPDALASVARVLPFAAMAYAPARQISGHPDPALLALQAGWLAVLLAAALGAFAAGERRLVVVGG
jgi:ABC-2 type transport system permease protein